MKEKAALRPLRAAEAKRAVFIDFEGTRKDLPSLLGVYIAGKKSFSQTVMEQALYPACIVARDFGRIEIVEGLSIAIALAQDGIPA